MDLIREVTQEYLKSDIPDFRPGDNVKVHVRLKEGDKERIQVFEGLVIARKLAFDAHTMNCDPDERIEPVDRGRKPGHELSQIVAAPDVSQLME